MIGDAELIRNARTPFELNADLDDAVSIITDTAMEPQVWSALNNAARSIGMEPTIAVMAKRDLPQADPTPQVRAAMLESDLCLMVTSQAIVHSDAGIAAQHQGTKLLAMEELTVDMLAGGAAAADYDEIMERGKRIRQLWTDGETCRLTTPHGTDLTSELGDRAGFLACGTVEEQPGVDLLVAAFPDGEAGISPIEGTSEGMLVWDTSMHSIGLIDEPIVATVESGYVTNLDGGREADQLRTMLESIGDQDAYNIAEISIGINPEATITGLMRQDKKSWGYIHVAVGSNSDTAGTIDVPIHVDGILSDATLTIDDTVVVEDGDVLV